MQILQELESLIPPLTSEEFKQLERNILEEGIRDPLVTWNGILVDGHNRYRIAQEHDMNYETLEKEFENLNDVKIWMVNNQLGRRNLQDFVRGELFSVIEDILKQKGKEKQLLTLNKGLEAPVLSTIDKTEHNTRNIISEKLGWSTGKKAMFDIVKTKAPEQVKEKLRTGEVSINQAYKEIKKEEKIETLEIKKKEYTEQSKSDIKISPEIHCIDAVSYLKKFEDNTIDLLITDPPYTTDVKDIKSFTKEWIEIALMKVKQNGRLYICSGAYPDEIQAFIDVLMNQDKFIVDNPLIWTYRNTLGITPKMKYNLNYQLIWHLYSNDSLELDTSITNEMFSVQDINAPDGRLGNRLHTWQKPDELANRLIRHGSKKGDLVVDCFACTGTFLIAAAKFDRIAKGCDISEDNLKIAKQRGCTINGKTI
jgi:DNA modification methylase/ParB-like chromosome segregation protein Spo0J